MNLIFFSSSSPNILSISCLVCLICCIIEGSLFVMCICSRFLNFSCKPINFWVFTFLSAAVLVIIFPLRTALAAYYNILGFTSPLLLSCMYNAKSFSIEFIKVLSFSKPVLSRHKVFRCLPSKCKVKKIPEWSERSL